MDRRCSQGSHINFNDHLRWDVFSREFDKLSVFCIWNVWGLFELVACCMLRELAPKGCASIQNPRNRNPPETPLLECRHTAWECDLLKNLANRVNQTRRHNSAYCGISRAIGSTVKVRRIVHERQGMHKQKETKRDGNCGASVKSHRNLGDE